MSPTASTQSWSEFNGAAPGTETQNVTNNNWMSIDSASATYTSYPITVPDNSYSKYQALVFGGSWNSLSSLTYRISSNAPATGVSIVGSVVTSYTAPSTTATGDSAMSTTGLDVEFGTSTTPFSTAGGSSTTAGGTMYANCLRTQLQTTSAAGPGDIGTLTITASWTES